MQTGITFDNPWAFALIPGIVVFIFLAARNLRFRSISGKCMIITLRILLMTCLVIAMASPEIKSFYDRTATVFIADVSDSVKKSGDEIKSFVQKALEYAGSKDVTGFISFADEAAVVKMPDENNKAFSLNNRIKTGGTNIENALTLAQSIMPENAAKRLVLITDGKETAGDAVEKAKMLNRLGFTVDVVPVTGRYDNEVQIEELNTPKQVNAKERFDISVKINSNVNTKAVIRLYQNRILAQEKTVELYQGENLFVFSDTAEDSGFVTYTAEVAADADTEFQNNQLSSFTEVLDKPRILLVEKGNNGENLVRYLGEYAYFARVKPEEVPVTMQEMMKYDAFVLVDIDYHWLDENFVRLLEQVIKNQGKGLLVTGGENSYAPGGYYGTLLETVLPVNMDIRQKEENPNLGLVLVIDKSGSMESGKYGISKIDLAKEAAIRAVEVLDDNDWLGVIAFDDAFKWVVKTEQLKNKQEVINKIGTIRANGGTQILPPLEAAWRDLRTKDTKLKHIILLTDGQAEQYGYDEIIESLREDGITLSTVAVGEEADTLLLRALANGGMGRYYYTDEFTDIPGIFAKEAFIAGKDYLQNRTFYPEPVISMGILKGIEQIPPLDGYVATRIKNTASTVFKSDTDDPVLAVWQYGLGRTAAWTSDIQGGWTSQWSIWQDAPLFWGNLASWLIQKNVNTGYSVNTEVKGSKGTVTLTFENNIPKTDVIEGVIVSPDGTSSDIKLYVKEPGVYEGETGQTNPGAYIINLNVTGTEGTENIRTGFVMPYSNEYRVLNEAGAFLEKLAKAGGGRIVNDPSEVFSGNVQDAGGTRNLANIFIIFSLCMLVIDIAARKLQLSADRLKEFAGRVISAHNTVVPEADTGSASCKNKKQRKPGKRPEEQRVSGETDHTGDTDHIGALLNRRKKWK